MGLTFIDIFCGAGGSSIGLTAAGFELKLAANHWSRAIETHSANFDRAEHLCADVSNYDMRRLPAARVLWASPICWEVSPAGGNHQPRQPLTEDDAPCPGWDRTRATAYDVIRAAEVWHYDAILIENVVEFATRWKLFRWWLRGLTALGYRYRIVCANSAHIGGPDNPQAPQWRDRLYIVFIRDGITMPDLAIRPLAYCPDCGEYVLARQTWKDTRWGRLRLGKYQRQYVYTCPYESRPHTTLVVEPYVAPAATAIDWSDIGPRVADMQRPLKPTTLAKIAAGLEMTCQGPTILQVNHSGHDGRHIPAASGALSARTSKGGDALLSPSLHERLGAGHEPRPFIAELRGGGSCTRPVDHPLATITAAGRHHGLVTPADIPPTDQPLGLVIPYRRVKAKPTCAPLHTLGTRDSAALIHPASVAVEDCHFRMLRPREHLRAQRFPDSYLVCGTRAEQTMQAGNAVSVNVAQWLGQRLAAVL